MRKFSVLLMLIMFAITPALADYDDCSSGDIVYVYGDYTGLSTGAYNAPFKTISAGITYAINNSKSCVYVAQDSDGYDEVVSCASGVNVYGGFNAANWAWTHDPEEYDTEIVGTPGSGSNYALVHMDNDDNLEFDGFLVTHASYYSNAILAENDCDEITISNNSVHKDNSSLHKCGIKVYGGYYGGGSAYIENNTVYCSSGHWEEGINIQQQAGDWHVKWNTVSTSAWGILAASNPEGYITDNKVVNTGIGIQNLWPDEIVHIQRNYIDGVTDDGIYTMLAGGSYVDNNVIDDFDQYGIRVNNGLADLDNKVFQNKMYASSDSGTTGIYIESSAKIAKCNFNWILKCDTGIDVRRACTINDNGIWNPNIGIDVSHSSGTVEILNNSIEKPDDYGVYVDTTSAVQVTNTIIYGDSTSDGSAGIRVPSTPGTLTLTYNNVDNLEDEYLNCSPGTGCFSSNPRWVAPSFSYDWDSDWRYYLRQSTCQSSNLSPCVNAGDSSTPYGCTRSCDTDIDSSTIDVGAHMPILQESKYDLDEDLRYFIVSKKSLVYDEEMFEYETKKFFSSARDIMKMVSDELKKDKAEDEETILIWFEGKRFPWKVSITEDTF